MTICAVALGANLGDIPRTFRQALDQLGAIPGVRLASESRLYRTAPAGLDAGGRFLNAAALLDSELGPFELMGHLRRVETELGRKRDVFWGPRTLDLDLIVYGDHVIRTPDLQVPHMACGYRRFVLDPLCELMGDTIHPVYAIPWRTLRNRLLPRPLVVTLWGLPDAAFEELHTKISHEFPDVLLCRAGSRDDEHRTGCVEAVSEQPPASHPGATAGLNLWFGDGGNAAAQSKAIEGISLIDLSAHTQRTWEAMAFVLVSALDAPEAI